MHAPQKPTDAPKPVNAAKPPDPQKPTHAPTPPRVGKAVRFGKAVRLQKAPGAVKRFFAGAGFLARGLGLWATSPKLMFLGAIPALIVGTIFTAGLVLFAFNLGAITAWITPFADEWDEPLRIITRIIAGLAAVGVVLFAALFSFTAITLAVGDPFYERIWREVENRAQAVENRAQEAPIDHDEPFWRSLRRGVGNGIRLFVATAAAGIALFAGGFIPIVGQTVVPVLGAAIGGWFLAVELSGFAFDARRLSLRERRRMLATNRAGTLGFGIATYLLFLVPFGAVFVMPAAVAGATFLSRSVLPQPELSKH